MKKQFYLILFIIGIFNSINGFCEDNPQQIITLIQPDHTVNIGEVITIPVEYSVSDGDNKLFGIGISLLYDSSVLEYVTMNIDLVSSAGKPAINVNVPKDDGHYIEDNDPDTDSIISIAWAAFGIVGSWPNEPLPVKLFDVSFRIKNQQKLNTKINSIVRVTSPGYVGTANTAQVLINDILNGDGNRNKMYDMQDLLILLRSLVYE